MGRTEMKKRHIPIRGYAVFFACSAKEVVIPVLRKRLIVKNSMVLYGSWITFPF